MLILEKKSKEHRHPLRNGNVAASAIAEHTLSTGHGMVSAMQAFVTCIQTVLYAVDKALYGHNVLHSVVIDSAYTYNT